MNPVCAYMCVVCKTWESDDDSNIRVVHAPARSKETYSTSS